jgi:ABC-type multidrug transport system ATPase subunit
MGASGAGKTTLLNAISDRISVKKGQSMTGDVLVNDKQALKQDSFGKFASYVMQDDILFEFFTPLQALTFAARLKLTWPIEKQDARVDKLLTQLNLQHRKNTLIGSSKHKSLSGGERKRTAIGVELISDPQLLLLDEPTSGLDSFMAKTICRILRDLARNEGKTIISTLHQPSSESFSYFDRLILMADGHIVYQGAAYESPEYFKGMDIIFPPFSNPADHFMKILSTGNMRRLKHNEEKIDKLMVHY